MVIGKKETLRNKQNKAEQNHLRFLVAQPRKGQCLVHIESTVNYDTLQRLGPGLIVLLYMSVCETLLEVLIKVLIALINLTKFYKAIAVLCPGRRFYRMYVGMCLNCDSVALPTQSSAIIIEFSYQKVSLYGLWRNGTHMLFELEL